MMRVGGGRIGVLLGAVAIAVVAGAAAAQADCLEDFEATWNKHADVRGHLAGEVQRDYRTLRRAAGVLRGEGREDACEEIAEAVQEMLEERRAALVKQGVILSQSEQQRRQRYANARPLTQGRTAVRSSDLVGAEVRNRKGERLGEVDDLYVDAAENNISYLIVERGGFLGMGEDAIAIPTDKVAVTEDMDTVLLDMAPRVFDQAPPLKGRDMIDDADWRSRNAEFFKVAGTNGK